MARRTRSFNELPGHLRVPILRRKDTERTQERLAAGLAGMEELKSLRQQQQQLVGQTMAKKAEDRLDRRHGYSGIQTNQPPRPPKRQSLSSLRGRSMDSISEEGDISTKNLQEDNENNDKQFDINNNNNSNTNNKNKDSRYSPRFNNMPRNQFSFDETQSWYTESTPGSVHSDPASICHSPIHQSYENEARISYGHRQLTDNTNPALSRNRTETIPPKYLRGTIDKTASDLMTSTRQSPMTETHCGKPAPRSVLQRSMSVDLGHCHGTPTFYPLGNSSPSKNGNSHRFSSLTCINASNEYTNDFDKNRESPIALKDASRLSQSTSQIDGVGHSLPQSRRGSLTWDNLLKSIGIQNSSSMTSLDKCDDDEVNDTVHDKDDVFNYEKNNEDYEKVQPEFMIHRKVGRSMSFTCYNSTNLLTPKSTTKNGLSPNVGAISSPNKNEQSLETNVYDSPQSIHPILRRASIQCEAVLTNSSRVVNPIKDVDVNRFESPGPLHAVMLQYKGYNSPPGKTTTVGQTQTINSSNVTAHTMGTQEAPKVSNECVSSTSNVVECPPPQSSKASSNLHSKRRYDGDESMSRSTPPPEQDQACDNVIQEDYLYRASNKSNNTFTKENCDSNTPHQRNIISDTATDKEQNGVNVNGSNKEIFLEPLAVNRQIESVSSKQPPSIKPRRHSSGTNVRGPNLSQEIASLAVDNNDGLSLSNRKTEEECVCVKLSNHTQIANGLEGDQCRHQHEQLKTHNDLRNGNPPKAKCVRRDVKREGRTCFDLNKNEIESNGEEISKLCNPHSPYETHVSHMTLVLNCQKQADHVGRTPKDSENMNNSGSSSPVQSSKSSQLQTQQIVIPERDRDVIRGKRASIFSDVSLMSDSSGRTPSSAASILSDVSMVSDEGYSTWGESTSSENKFSTLSTSVTSFPRPTSLAFADTNRKDANRPSHPACKVTHGSKCDKKGSNVGLYSKSSNCDKETSNSFSYDKEITLERTTPIIFTPSEPGQVVNIQTVVSRKSCKQTTV